MHHCQFMNIVKLLITAGASRANMPGIGSLNLKVVLFDSDFYALQSINSYLAWDRRTRVMFMSYRIDELWEYLSEVPIAELPDVVVLDGDHLGGPDGLKATIRSILQYAPEAHIFCLAQHVDVSLVEAAAEAGARGFFLKQELRMQIAWAIASLLDEDYLVTPDVARICKSSRNSRIYNARVLPDQREYPEMTDRIRQAIKLCVIDGMPAHLAADEMGISLHTIRGYIKEGYRILESYDHFEYPTDMTPQERAFMRFTALAIDDE